MKRLLSLSLGAALASAAVAGNVTMTYLGGIYDGTFTNGSTNFTAGLIQASYTGTVSGMFNGYCLSPSVALGTSWGATRYVNTQMDTSLTITAAQAAQIGYLAGLYAGGGTAVQHATAQIAIWQVLGFTPTVISDPNNVLGAGIALYNSTLSNGGAYIFYESDYNPGTNLKQSQDLVEAVPEPFTMALGAAGLALAVARKRRSRKA